MNTVSDNLSSDNIKVSIISGSFGEGLQMIGSDLDIMFVIKPIEVHDNITSIVFNSKTTYFSLMTEDTKPGYVMLRLTSSPHAYVRKSCEQFRSKSYLSNILFKNFFLGELTPVVHGPCVSDRKGYFDYALCLHSKYWVTSASQWTIRSNNSWPNEKTKQLIINHGVLFVPIGSKGSPHEELEWRMSFSVGEKLLIYTFSHTQLLCYALMKIILKDVINTDSKCKDLLCSYILKTTIFWLSEESQPSLWKPDNLIHCFMRCFRRLIYCVEYQVCPHYFIPENNLFENKIEGHDWNNLIVTLRVLLSYGWQCIFFSRQISHISVLSCNIQNDPSYLYYEDINKLLKSNIFVRVYSVRGAHNYFRKAVHYSMAYNTKKLKYLHAYFVSSVCYNTCESIYLTSAISNKNLYKQNNTCLSYLLMNINHNTVSGWLMLASFFYKANQYRKSLNIILYALSKCTPEKLFLGAELSVMQRRLVKWHAVRKQGVVRSLRFVLVDYVIFKTSTFIPVELLIEGIDVIIPPVVYAHVLSFLCYYHLEDVRECRNSLRKLQLTIAENYFVGEEKSPELLSHYCLGTALQLMGDTVSAKQIFVEIVKLYPFPYILKQLKRLSLVLLV
ncbi:uncharacterized protein LOC127715968 [Mytilus californianus]|uniref:uncharacterized protein LOC127715968 n=1 Tax=Mytilus californianus TaxID=6549 RepID=UPI0022479E59|nr:uncharacterized protein LOC127715968 [Mytilus californianus]